MSIESIYKICRDYWTYSYYIIIYFDTSIWYTQSHRTYTGMLDRYNSNNIHHYISHSMVLTYNLYNPNPPPPHPYSPHTHPPSPKNTNCLGISILGYSFYQQKRHMMHELFIFFWYTLALEDFKLQTSRLCLWMLNREWKHDAVQVLNLIQDSRSIGLFSKHCLRWSQAHTQLIHFLFSDYKYFGHFTLWCIQWL